MNIQAAPVIRAHLWSRRGLTGQALQLIQAFTLLLKQALLIVTNEVFVEGGIGWNR